ncbi:hypothetical protein [Plantactinospora sp. KLBMP9567]|uniref:hypothetical protein n=1 Tax=Plantactinospora sp. KLBMP9567 TaxID=3085900 RepID=UPI002981C3F9|nr:hypothetical protein [Plantactinospora sp. KLBMP9567]MDW5327760.1 hypothetical protein [Plantactinospora sp. KLBMP9567]
MPNHGYEPPAPVLLARHRRSGGAHVGYRRVTGVHRAEGLGRPARRYLFTVALLAGTSSLPILAAIGSGSATVSDGMRPADATPFAPPSPGALPGYPTVPPLVEPGPAGTGARSGRTGWLPFLVPTSAVPDRPSPTGSEPGRVPSQLDPPAGNEPGTPPSPTVRPPTQSPTPAPPPVTSPSPVPSASPGYPTGAPSAGPTSSPAPTDAPSAPAAPVPTSTVPTPGTTASAGPVATPGPTGHPATPAPTPAPVPSTPPAAAPS